MGRIRTRWIKNIAEELVSKYPDRFTNKFEENKKVLKELDVIKDKSIRNKVAGFIVRVVEKKKF